MTAMKLNKETKTGLAVLAAIYVLFTVVRLVAFPEQSFMWHFELGLFGLVSILFF